MLLLKILAINDAFISLFAINEESKILKVQ